MAKYKSFLLFLASFLVLGPVSVFLSRPEPAIYQAIPGATAAEAFTTQQICQLTGVNNTNVTNVKGTDLGISFSHKDKLYFIFGDTNLSQDQPKSDLANILAFTRDTDPEDCLKLSFITAQNLYKNPADFFARESVIQAEEEKSSNQDIDKLIFDNYSFYYQWSRTQEVSVLTGELNRKFKKILTFYQNQGPDQLAAYYAKTAVRFNLLGFAFQNPDDPATRARDYLDYQAHYLWAKDTATQFEAIYQETVARSNHIFDLLANKKVKQAIPSKTFAAEVTLIPTGAISDDNKIFAFYQSVKSWGEPGYWQANFSGVAVSENDGASFTRHANLFGSDSNFIQIYPVKPPSSEYIYLFGLPAGRTGFAKLARVAGDLTDSSAYQFCQLTDSNDCLWINQEQNASFIISFHPVGEISVVFNPYLSLWQASYLNPQAAQLVLTTAKNLWGPWSPPQTLLDCQSNLPTCYGAFSHQNLMVGNGQGFYFTTSTFNPYNVHLFRADLPLPTPIPNPSPTPTPSPTPYLSPTPTPTPSPSSSNCQQICQQTPNPTLCLRYCR